MMKSYDTYLKENREFGTVIEVNYPVLTAQGLPGASLGELVLFESGQTGQVFNLNEDSLSIMLMSKQSPAVGTALVRTNIAASVAVGEGLLGAAIDSLGSFINASRLTKNMEETREIDPDVQPIRQLSLIKKPLLSGVTLVDLLIPLGKGQKELVVGDRKTGKSSFFLSLARYQTLEKAVVIYCLIGKNKADAKNIYQEYKKAGLLDNMVFVVTTSDDAPGLVYLAPYTAMTVAEYFRDKGRDAVVIFDDISTHARYYREIKLISGVFPGRESYPGDVFYLHSRLLERAGNYLTQDGSEVSISCFPIVETVEGDLTGYIPTNVMSMTDGHIFFDSNAYYNGRRPAINIHLSVTRVGRQTQSTLRRELGHEVMMFLTKYESLQNFSHFGAELSQHVKEVLNKGELLYKLFDQHYSSIIPENLQLVLFAVIWLGLVDKEKDMTFEQIRDQLIEAYSHPGAKEFFAKVIQADNFYSLLTNVTKFEADIAQLWRTKKQ